MCIKLKSKLYQLPRLKMHLFIIGSIILSGLNEGERGDLSLGHVQVDAINAWSWGWGWAACNNWSINISCSELGV
jgi:hypothetical protein